MVRKALVFDKMRMKFSVSSQLSRSSFSKVARLMRSTLTSPSVSTLTGSVLSLPKRKAGAMRLPALSRLTSTSLPEIDDMRQTSTPLTTMSAFWQDIPASA